MRILVAVLGTRGWVYSTLIKTIKRTWATADIEDIETVFYYGGDVFETVGADVFLPADDDLWHVGQKTRAFFSWALENREFDLLYRTNASTYLDLRNLREYAQAHVSLERFYSGVIGTHQGVSFASGAGYFLSRDLVTLAAAAEWNHRSKDDWSLGELLNQHHVYPTAAPRCTIERQSDLSRFDVSMFNFRCKTQTTLRQGDVQLMLAVHRRFCEARGIAVPWSLSAHYAMSRIIEAIGPTAIVARRLARQGGQQARARFRMRGEIS
jgi:hypothetical protein